MEKRGSRYLRFAIYHAHQVHLHLRPNLCRLPCQEASKRQALQSAQLYAAPTLAQALFEKWQHAQTTVLFPPGRHNIPVKSVRIPAEKLFARRKNPSPLGTLPFI
ncbi:MAG: hypothetical protein HFF17_09095 [Oscillospiraceae bacterium]|nr:hypothetical protein [Oscillospiraceae bacterium]